MKTKLLVVLFMILATTKGFGSEVKFKLNSSHDQLNGGFKNSSVEIKGSKIKGTIQLKSIYSNKPEKKEDLLDYFEASDHPTGSFEVKMIGNKLVGNGKMKGEDFKLTGEVENGEARIRLSLKELIGGFKANFINEKDNVEMIIKLK